MERSNRKRGRDVDEDSSTKSEDVQPDKAGCTAFNVSLDTSSSTPTASGFETNQSNITGHSAFNVSLGTSLASQTASGFETNQPNITGHSAFNVSLDTSMASQTASGFETKVQKHFQSVSALPRETKFPSAPGHVHGDPAGIHHEMVCESNSSMDRRVELHSQYLSLLDNEGQRSYNPSGMHNTFDVESNTSMDRRVDLHSESQLSVVENAEQSTSCVHEIDLESNSMDRRVNFHAELLDQEDTNSILTCAQENVSIAVDEDQIDADDSCSKQDSPTDLDKTGPKFDLGMMALVSKRLEEEESVNHLEVIQHQESLEVGHKSAGNDKSYDHAFLTSDEQDFNSKWSTPVKQAGPSTNVLCDLSPIPSVDDASSIPSAVSPHNEDNSIELDNSSSTTSSKGPEDHLSSNEEENYNDNSDGDSSVCSISSSEDDHVKARAKILNAFDNNEIKVHEYSNLSVNEAIVDLLKLYLKNGDSKAGLQRTVDTFCKYLPEDHNLPSSAPVILNYVKSLAPPHPAVAYFYCRHCLVYLGKEIGDGCSVCDENDLPCDYGKFYCFDVGVILKYLFECRNLAAAMDLSQNVGNERCHTYRDIVDGSVYRNLNVNRGKYDVNIMLFFDGVRIRSSSSKELWLVMCSPIEVPVHLRESFTAVVGIWYDTVKPDMNTLLFPYCNEMRELDSQGVTWRHPDTKLNHKSCVKNPLVVADAPARAKAQNVVSFNGIYGCNTCESKAVLSTPVPGKKRLRVHPYVRDPVLRDSATMLAQAKQAQEIGQPVKGVKGPSVLSIVPSLDIATSLIPEYMHGVLLGVEKHLLSIWTSHLGDWNIKSVIPVIDDLLAEIRHPDFVHRARRALKSLKFWKASDLYYFLLFESVPVLKGRLQEPYFQHYLLLVRGIYLLLQSCVTETDIDEADMLLKLFVLQFPDLYTDRRVTYYVHQLSHLGLWVRRHGPLFSNSAFSFENLNGIVAAATHGTNFIPEEIANNVKIAQGLQMLQKLSKGKNGNAWFVSSHSPGEVLGKAKDIPAEELHLFGGRRPSVFPRARIAYDMYSSEIHKKLQSEDFHVMFKLQDENEKYAKIKYFALIENKMYLCLRMFKVDHLSVVYHRETEKSITHIVPVQLSEDIIVVKVGDLISSLIKVGKIQNFLIKRPNLFHFVL